MGAFECWEGIEERLATIGALGDILLGEPRGALDKPAIYCLYLDFDTTLTSSPPATNQRGKEHHFALYLVVSWVDQAAAEAQLMQLIDSITDAIEDDPHLGGRVPNGMARCSRGVTGFNSIGSRYRIVNFTVTVKENRTP